MTLGLARRLLWDGLVTPDDVSRALHAHVTRRISFLAALSEEHPGILPRIEAELGWRSASGARIEVDEALFASAPHALWVMLCAVPLGRTADGRGVRVAAPDGGDGHVQVELGHQLGKPIEIVQSSPEAVLAALAAPPGSSGARPSDAPIPLLRVSGDADVPHTVRGAPSIRPGEPPRVGSAVVLSPRGASSQSDPVIQLTRTKSLGPPPPAPASEPAVGSPPSAEAAAPALEGIELATSADEVASALARGLGAVCRRAVVLAVNAKARTFEGRASSDEAGRAAARALTVPSDRPSVLLTALQTGHYVGAVPNTPSHEGLAAVLGAPTGEILAGVVMVSGRPALVYAAAGFDTAYLATRRGGELAEAAGRKLERLLRDRKR